jgi:hypothetical protein
MVLIYQKFFGLKDDLSGPQNTPVLFKNDDTDSSSTISEENSVNLDEKSKFYDSARPKNEDTEANE